MQPQHWYAVFYFALESVCFVWFLHCGIQELKRYSSRLQSRQNAPRKCTSLAITENLIDSSKHLVLRSSSGANNLGLDAEELENTTHLSISDESVRSSVYSAAKDVSPAVSAKYVCSSCCQVAIWLFTLFISLFMQINKFQYRFTEKDIGWVHEENFSFYNNAYKVLSLIGLCYTWHICRVNGGIQNGIYHLFEKSKFYSFDRLGISVLIAFLITYDLMYTYFIKHMKWDQDIDAASAVMYYNLFCIISVCLSLSLDFDLYEILRRNRVQMYTEVAIFSMLLSNIIIAIQYNILVFMVESKSLLSDAPLLTTTIWTVYGFANNYLLFGLTKIFLKKLVFHHRSIRPYKPRPIQPVPQLQ